MIDIKNVVSVLESHGFNHVICESKKYDYALERNVGVNKRFALVNSANQTVDFAVKDQEFVIGTLTFEDTLELCQG